MKPDFLLIKKAHILAPEDKGIADLLITGGTIAAVEPKLDVRLPGLEVLDAAGLYVMPGLFDQHVHITGGGGEKGFSSRIPELSAECILDAGVTSLVGLLGTDSLTRSAENLLAKTKALKELGLSAWCLTGAYNIDGPTVTGSVGGDVCFIEEILGVKVAINDHRSSNPTVEELIRLACNVRLAALTAGKVGEVHLHVGRGKKGLQIVFDALEQSDLPISHFRPTHCENIPDDAERFGQMGGWVDITADDDPSVSADQIVRLSRRMPADHITLSSDAGGSIPVWNEKKEIIGFGVGTPSTLLPVIRSLVLQKGMPIGQALSVATRSPADALGLTKKGRIEAGADSDFLIADENLDIISVWTGGKLRRSMQ